MDIFIKGSQAKKVTLTNNNYLASGGQANIYLKGNEIFKIYIDPNDMIPVSKINELQVLNRDNIISPKNVIVDKDGREIGYTMKFIKDSIPLCKLFTNDFRHKFNIDEFMTLELVKNIQKDIPYIHSKNCLIVDGNEMNYLVDKNFIVPYFIDVDSWQTKSFPATAIMLSIRDFHSKDFNELTDWFSFAVIATQLFLGIHPYKGLHPNFKKSDLEGRMKANISIFNKDVRIPSTVRDFDSIPSNYKEWLFRVLEKGERLLPPDTSGTLVVPIKVINDIKSIKFVIELIKNIELHLKPTNTIYSPFTSKKVEVSIVDNKLNMGLIPCNIDAEEKIIVDNSVFIKNNDRLIEISVEEMNNKLLSVIKNSWGIMPHSTKMFNGFVYQDILNTPWLMIPYLINGKRAMFQKMIPELKGKNVLEAKYENQIANIIVEENGKYNSLFFKFSKDFSKYIYFEELDVIYHVPNFVVLDNGICIRITVDDEVHIFSNNIDKQDCKVLKDDAVDFSMKLHKNGITPYLMKDNKLYKFSMK